MEQRATYSGRRDRRLVTLRRGGTLDDGDHRLLVGWAADCAEHVFHLFTDHHPDDDRLRRAIDQARGWSRRETAMTRAREAAYAAHQAARETSGVAREAARAAGHAVATAHMADHELGASAYAIRAVRHGLSDNARESAGHRECRWQRDQLPDAIRNLVLSDQEVRNHKFWSLFGC
ncbi:MAG: hypothetical protein M3Y17_03785 [Actinomycetota bacterium]|nr:hypothetical protein [Actinomycetota bacterium]